MGETTLTEQSYQPDREYSVWQIFRCNLKKWWLMLICALVCAALLGSYKYYSNRRFVTDKAYEEINQVMATLYVKEYSGESATERVGTVIKTGTSNAAYQKLLKSTGYDLEFPEYQQMFDLASEGDSDIITVYVKYPNNYGDFSLRDERDALEFTEALIGAIDGTTEEMTGTSCIRVLDQPYVANTEQRMLAYAPTKEKFMREIAKAATAGLLLGVIIEVALYTCWTIYHQKKESEQ